MKNSVLSSLPRILLPISLICVIVTPVHATWLNSVTKEKRFTIGSAASPSAEHVRGRWYYPSESLNRNEQGAVAVKVFLDEDGEAKDAVVEKSSGFQRLDEAAVAYVKEKYDYDPAPGERMPEFVRTIVNFRAGLAP